MTAERAIDTPDTPDTAPMAQTITLGSGELRLLLAPAIGGSIAAFYSEHAAGRLDWLRPASSEALRGSSNPLRMASFPLLPWCNRIRDGRAAFGGREIRVAPNHPGDPASPHPLHGIGWRRPWEVVEATDRMARLELTVAADAEWPWRFRARQTFLLRPDRLDCTIDLVNDDTAVMPAGIGHHPYFPHRPGTRLTARTEAIWRSDDELLPTDLQAGSEVEALRDGILLAALDLDNNFSGWDHRAVIDWPSLDARLVLAAEPPLDHFVLYCPTGFDHFCAEPVSQCTDAINLADQWPAAELGGAVLRPGEALSGRWSLTPQRR